LHTSQGMEGRSNGLDAAYLGGFASLSRRRISSSLGTCITATHVTWSVCEAYIV
jgi:hypothetical protein